MEIQEKKSRKSEEKQEKLKQIKENYKEKLCNSNKESWKIEENIKK